MAETSGWQLHGSGPAAYERYIVPAFMGGWASDLVARAALAPGERLLDVACGTGVVARLAAQQRGSGEDIAALDINAGMLQAARALAAQEGVGAIDWQQGDVAAMPFAEASFDVILCQQGLQYFPDRAGASRDMRRVLRPGGRLLLSVWRAETHQPFFQPALAILDATIGTSATAPLHAALTLSEQRELHALLDSAGFGMVQVRLEVQLLRYSSAEAFLPGWLAATPLAAAVNALSETERHAMFTALCEAFRDYTDDGGLAVPLECHIVTATR